MINDHLFDSLKGLIREKALKIRVWPKKADFQQGRHKVKIFGGAVAYVRPNYCGAATGFH